MDTTLVMVVIVVGILGFIALAFLLGVPQKLFSGGGNPSMRNLVGSQRTAPGASAALRGDSDSHRDEMLKNFELRSPEKNSSELTLRKRLKFAQWNMPIIAFHLFEVGISLLSFSIASLYFAWVLRLIALSAGPLFMRWLLNYMMDRRFKKFDADYPSFLMSVVGLLKTGMTVMGALEAASQGLEPGSLVREEVEMMIERLRFGVSEDKSIGAFGEDICHPEIELFVQALLLSRRVGGALSDTLERLSKQVRKRQYFRNSAISAVGMQRGSIWVIIGLLVAIEVYLAIAYPVLVFDAIQSEIGWQVWQFGIVAILLGIFWVRQVTKIRV